VAYDFSRSGFQLENRVLASDGGVPIDVTLIDGTPCNLTNPSIVADGTVSRGATSLNITKGTGAWLNFEEIGSSYVLGYVNDGAYGGFSVRTRVKFHSLLFLL
jgi:hypothetical protein